MVKSEQRGTLLVAAEGVIWGTHCGRHLAVSLKLIVKLPYNQALPLLDVYQRELELRVHAKPIYISSKPWYS